MVNRLGAFPARTAAMMAQIYVAKVPGSRCMAAVYKGLEGLYSPEFSSSIAVQVSGDARSFLKKTGLNTDHMDRIMETIRGRGMAEPAVVLTYNRNMNTWSPDPQTTILNMMQRNASGWHFFGVSLHAAYHAVILAVDNTDPENLQIYWLDQGSIGLDDNVTDILPRKMTSYSPLYGFSFSKIWQFLPAGDARVGHGQLSTEENDLQAGTATGPHLQCLEDGYRRWLIGTRRTPPRYGRLPRIQEVLKRGCISVIDAVASRICRSEYRAMERPCRNRWRWGRAHPRPVNRGVLNSRREVWREYVAAQRKITGNRLSVDDLIRFELMGETPVNRQWREQRMHELVATPCSGGPVHQWELLSVIGRDDEFGYVTTVCTLCNHEIRRRRIRRYFGSRKCDDTSRVEFAGDDCCLAGAARAMGETP